MSSNAPTLADAITSLVDAAVDGVRVMVDARVVAVNGDVVDIQPLVADRETDADGSSAWVSPPVLPNIPVARMKLGPLTIAGKPDVGDIGMALIRDRSHDEVDGGNAPASGSLEPASTRRWDWSDAVFLPVSVVPGELSSIRDDGQPVLDLDAGVPLRVGDKDASSAVALAQESSSNYSDIAATLTPIVTAWNAVASGGGGPLIVPTTALPVYLPTPVASSRLLTDD